MLFQHGGDGDRSVEMEGGKVHGEAGALDEGAETVSYIRAGVAASVSVGFRG